MGVPPCSTVTSRALVSTTLPWACPSVFLIASARARAPAASPAAIARITRRLFMERSFRLPGSSRGAAGFGFFVGGRFVLAGQAGRLIDAAESPGGLE